MKYNAYKLNDNLFTFWFRFLSEASPLFEQGFYELVYDEIIHPDVQHYVSCTFEDICIQYLKRINGKGILPITFYNIGRWWGNNKIEKRQEEIDIMATDNKDSAIFGECKWTANPVDLSILNNLVQKSKQLPYGKKYYMLFSKSGFTNEVIEVTKENPDIFCFSLEDVELLLRSIN